MNPKILYMKELKTSIGNLMFGASQKGLCLLDFKFRKSFPSILKRIHIYFGKHISNEESEIIQIAENEIDLYLQGKLKDFSVPLDIQGTPFQKKVWNALLKIKYGTTVSYQDIATEIGQPKAFRAVANANGQNGIAIIIPCHRVIGSDGTLTGYGGGLPLKRKLLRLESDIVSRKITDYI